MKALNDAYITSIGSAYDASANYLFFLKATGSEKINDRDITGFMPRGAQFGYLFTSEIQEDYVPAAVAHELGHGRWKLVHPFDANYGGLEEAIDTENLMAYGNGLVLAKWQWDIVNDPAMLVSLFEKDEESASTSANWAVMDPDLVNAATNRCTLMEAPDCNYFLVDGDIFSIADTHRQHITNYELVDGQLVQFTVATDNAVLDKGTYIRTMQATKNNEGNIIDIYYGESFSCYECVATADTRTVYGIDLKTYTESKLQETQYVALTAVTCGESYEVVVRCASQGDQGLCESLPQACDDNTDCDQFVVATAVNEEIAEAFADDVLSLYAQRKAITSDHRDQGTFVHLLSNNGSMTDQQREIIEEKLFLLYAYEDIYMVVVFMEISDNQRYDRARANEMADLILRKLQTKSSDAGLDKFVVVLNPVSHFESVIGETSTTCGNIGAAQPTGSNIIDTDFESQADYFSTILGIFASIEKQVYLDYYYIAADGSLMNKQVTSQAAAGKGYPFINNIKINDSPYLEEIIQRREAIDQVIYQIESYGDYLESKEEAMAEALSSDDGDADDNEAEREALQKEIDGYRDKLVYYETLHDSLKQTYETDLLAYLQLDYNAFSENTSDYWVGHDQNIGKFRETYMRDSELVNAYILAEIRDAQWEEQVYILSGLSEVKSEHLYTFDYTAIMDATVYGVVDDAGFIPAASDIADIVGFLYSLYRNDYSNTATYAAGMAVPIVGGKAVKTTKEIYLVLVKKTATGEGIEFVVKKTSKEILNEELEIFSIVAASEAEAKQIVAQSEEYINKSGAEELLDKITALKKASAIVARWAAFTAKYPKLAAKIESLGLKERFLTDFADGDPIIDIFAKALGTVDAWKRALNIFPVNSKFITDIPMLTRVSKIEAEGSAFRAVLGENWSAALSDILKNASDLKCSNCGDAGRIGRSSIDQYLDDVNYFVTNFDVSTGGKGSVFYGWMRNTSTPTSGQLDELHQTIRDLAKREIKESQVEGLGKQFPIGTKRYDLRRIGDKYTEYKNKDFVTYPLTASSDDVDQFINGYLKNVSSMDDLEWKAGFDKLKSTWPTESEALVKMKTQWKSVFESKADDVFDVIWGNQSLKMTMFDSGLSKSDAKIDFEDMISEPSNSFFDFIKVE